MLPDYKLLAYFWFAGVDYSGYQRPVCLAGILAKPCVPPESVGRDGLGQAGLRVESVAGCN